MNTTLKQIAGLSSRPTILSLSLAALSITTFTASATPKKKPNILWVLTDDHRADSIQAYNRATLGQSNSELGYVMSPEADKLAKDGVLFTRAYCNSPACAPSRTSMHYGMYPHHSGHYGFEKSHMQTPFAQKFIPTMMSERGYKTAIFGKSGYYVQKMNGKKMSYHSYYDTEVRMKDITNHKTGDWSKNPTFANRKKAFDTVTWNFPDGPMDVVYHAKNGKRTEEQEAMKKEVYKKLNLLSPYGSKGTPMIIGGVSPSSTEKTTDGLIAQNMQQFLHNADGEFKTPWGDNVQGADTNKPLFMHLSFHFPHTPVLPSKEFREIFKTKEKEIPYKIPDFNKSELKKLPPQLVKWFKKMNFADLSDTAKRQAIRDYYAFCAMGDKLVGQSVDAFKEYSKKQGRDWLVLYVIGDHGWHLGEQGGEAKFAPYDMSNHCAVIAVSSNKKRWPAGKVSNEFVEFVDFAPTMLKESGAKLNSSDYAHLDGMPMDEIYTGKKSRDYVLGEMNHVMGPRCYLRSDDFAFSMRNREKNGKPGDKWGHKPGQDIQWALKAPRKKVELALFDLRVDPKEQNNVADDPKYSKLADWFRNKLGRITLGDGRVECNWKKPQDYVITDFAKGAHDSKLNIPKKLIPRVKKRRK